MNVWTNLFFIFLYYGESTRKKYNQAASLIESDRIYSLDEAVALLERTNTVKFDPTIEIHFNLSIDPRQADQIVRSTLSLPHGTGKTKRIAAFTDIGNEAELKAMGVSVAGGDDLIDSVLQGHVDFDIAIATPGMMKKWVKLQGSWTKMTYAKSKSWNCWRKSRNYRQRTHSWTI